LKPAAFDYVVPQSIGEVVSCLASAGDEAKVLAGGQSLVPAMNFRLSRPATLVDINNLAELRGLSTAPGGAVSVGALTRHVELEKNELGGPAGAILAEVGRWVGHVPVRMRGTIGGSLAHADPSAEWGVLAVTVDASVDVVSTRGERRVEATDFFRSVFVTDLAGDEIITGIGLPALGPQVRFGFREFARRAGDFALVAVLAVVDVSSDGSITDARVGLGGVGATPLRARDAEVMLIGSSLTDEVRLRAAADAAAEGVDPPADIHGSKGFRKKLVRNLTFDALKRAAPVA
jgi:carbon-monoxide dehydrogenase medium subunit